MDSLDKSTTKALTAAFKYALLQMFCVGRGEDGDAGKGYEDQDNSAVRQINRQSENAAVRAASAAPLIPGDMMIDFGKHNGKMLSQIETYYVKWLMESTEKQLQDPAKANYKLKNKKVLDACLRELGRRAQNAQPDEPPPLDDADLPFGR